MFLASLYDEPEKGPGRRCGIASRVRGRRRRRTSEARSDPKSGNAGDTEIAAAAEALGVRST